MAKGLKKVSAKRSKKRPKKRLKKVAKNGSKNGAFLVVVNAKGELLLVKRKKNGLWELPGGTIERGELPAHAAQEETEEESGVLTDAVTFTFVAQFTQRPYGIVNLYETRKSSGRIDVPEDSDEVLAARWMSFEQIIKQPKKMGTGALRMILRWRRCSLKIDKMPYEGHLSASVEFLKNLKKGQKYSDFVLTV